MIKLCAIVVVTIFWMECSVVVADPHFKIVTKRDNDIVHVKLERDKAIFSVGSPMGISQTTITRTTEKWPNSIVLQLHLKGLENFKMTNGSITLEAAVSNQDGSVRQWKKGKEDSLLDAESPYWMKICLVGKNGEVVKTIPLDDGYFEIQLPKAFFENNPKSITVNWIDFYR